MPTSSYSSASSASSDGSGSAYSWILDHLLMYPSTYELPLRTMYQLNCSAGAQLVAYQPSPPDTPNLAEAEGGTADATRSPGLAPSQVPGSAMAAASQFRSNLMAHLANLPAQPLSLPPKFITDFVRRCFSENLVTVDFVQALTGMDYLRDLEMRRRREFAGVLKRLGLDGNIASVEGDGRSSSERVLEAWVMEMNSKSRNVESLYSQCYVGLRRWTLINEMCLQPFNVTNCMAMLNTLYPPAITSQPTKHLTAAILHDQRHGLFRYISAVQRNGTEVLANLMQQGRREERGEINGWSNVKETVDMYLRAANSLIDECTSVIGIESILQNADAEYKRRNGRKIDSGVSFISEDRPSTGSSSMKRSSKDKPLPMSPTDTSPTTGALPSSKIGGSTLERLAREFRKLRKKDEPGKEDKKEETKPRTKSLKKMKSTSALGEGKNRVLMSGGIVTEKKQRSYTTPQGFTLDEEGRRQAIEEALANRANKGKHRPLVSFEV